MAKNATKQVSTPATAKKGSRGSYLQWTLTPGQKIPRSTAHYRRGLASRPRPRPKKKLKQHPLGRLVTRPQPRPLSPTGPAPVSASSSVPTLPTVAQSPTPNPSPPKSQLIDDESQLLNAASSGVDPLSEEHFSEYDLSGQDLLETDRALSRPSVSAAPQDLHVADGFQIVENEEGCQEDDAYDSEDSFVLRLDEEGEEEENEVAEDIGRESPENPGDSLDDISTEVPDLYLSIQHRIQMLLLLSTIQRHNLTYPAAEDIMNLAGVLSEKEVFVPYKHLIKKTIKVYSCSVTEHHMCHCGRHMGVIERDTFTCATCERTTNTSVNKRKGNIFLYMSLKEQLEALLAHHSMSILKPCERNKINQYNYEDIFDGKQYKHLVKQEDTISINFFVDGVQVATTSKKSAWPVLACLNELPLPLRRKHLFLVSLWLSLKKPDCQEYLKPFVQECIRLQESGITFEKNGVSHHFKVKILVGISDTIARPLLRNSMQFNGKYGCGLCLHPGIYMKHQKGHIRSFSTSQREYPMRNHAELMDMARAAENAVDPVMGIRGISVLSQIPDFDMARGLDLDLFHALVNVAKRFARLWFKETHRNKPYGCFNSFEEVDSRLLQVTPSSDVSRNPRSLKHMSDYRGHEWFHWVVDYSVPVLKGILGPRFLNHWSYLVHGIALVMQNSVSKSDVVYAGRYLSKFVKGIDDLYGKQHVTFSAHLLTHLQASVTDYGPPYAHSAFIFESYNAELKQAVKSSTGASQQICIAMQRKIAIKKLEEEVRDYMTDGQKDYFKLVAHGRPLALPHLTIGKAALLGQPKTGTLPPDFVRAFRRAGVQCESYSEVLSYERCQLDNEVYHSTSYSRATKQNNSVVLLNSDEVFVIDSFVVFNQECFVMGNFIEINRQKKLCDDPLPHIMVLKDRVEGTIRCSPVCNIDSKLMAFTLDSETGETLNVACINVMQTEMLR